MKLRATKKDFRNRDVISIPYCNLQYTLNFHSPIAYSAGSYGWSCDYYHIGDSVYISTGYSPIGKSLDSHFIKKIEDKARDIVLDNSKSYVWQKRALNHLLKKVVRKYRELSQ